MIKSGERLSFANIFQEKGYEIVVPLIQRDYAQGRKNEDEVRDNFLEALKSYLIEEIPFRDLDFVYGSLIEQEGLNTKFIPLDGQQRLTTLFLLHWYLSIKDGCFLDFQNLILNENNSKFTYETRTSSKDFCNALCLNKVQIDEISISDEEIEIDENDILNNSFSKHVCNSSWYFSSWQKDPTITAMLRMLNRIHFYFHETNGFYKKLIDDKKPIITFQFLDLDEYNLSDDLYIKMNARGEALTGFENFKAKLENKLVSFIEDGVKNYELKIGDELHKADIKQYFSHKIDTSWSNLFWKFRKKDAKGYDDEIMNFITTMIVCEIANSNSNFTVSSREILTFPLSKLSFKYLNDKGVITKDLIENIITFLDLIEDKGNYKTYISKLSNYDEINVFKNLIQYKGGEFLYVERILFYAYSRFLIKWKSNNGIDSWMRVVRNLTINTAPYNSELDFKRSIKTVDNLLKESNDILNYLIVDENIDGFNPAQVFEEKIKACLILKSQQWADTIYSVEDELKYFTYQISFILNFAGIKEFFETNLNLEWSDVEDNSYTELFNNYFEKGKAVFTNAGIRLMKNNLWERALLTKGNYLLTEGMNDSFLIDNDRDISWKRLLLGDKNRLKTNYIKELFDDDLFDKDNLENSLNKIIDRELDSKIISSELSYFIKEPRLFNDLGTKRYIRRKSANTIYLLSGERTSGEHTEYHTRSLFYLFFEGRNNFPYAKANYYKVSGESEDPCVWFPSIQIGVNKIELDISQSGSGYYFYLFDTNLPKMQFEGKILDFIKSNDFKLNEIETQASKFIKFESFENEIELLFKEINNCLA
jgi:hypothetical protein